MSPALAYEAVAVTEGGTIAGKVVYNGPVTTRKIIPTKDQEVCGDMREEPDVVVGADKSVEGAVVYLREVAKGKAWQPREKSAEVDNVKCRFAPVIQVIAPGEIEVVNSDPVLHNTRAFYGRRSAFNLALPNQGQRIKAELPRGGQVRLECDAHGWMQGWIYVVENPYYAVTPAAGTFSLTEVPPGSYTLVASQPNAGTVEIPVVVKAKETVEVVAELKK
jgi:hypothetical protein